MLKHQLIRLRVPKFSQSQINKLRRLVRKFEIDPESKVGLQALDSINLLVAEAFGLTDKEVLMVKNFLRPIHDKSVSKSKIQQFPVEEIESNFEPVKLAKYNRLHLERFDLQHLVTFKNAKKKPIHSWYPYTQGFDEELVRRLIEDFNLEKGSTVLDPFAGVGTTGIACRKAGMKSVLNDISPLVHWVSSVKNSTLDVEKIESLLNSGVLKDAESYKKKIELNPDLFTNFFENAYSSAVLEKVLRILAFLRDIEDDQVSADFLRLMLIGRLESMSNIRKHGSHYRYLNNETSVGLEKLNIPVFDPQGSVSSVLEEAARKGLQDIKDTRFLLPGSSIQSFLGDSKNLNLSRSTIDAVITSPPYLNRNNYIAQQKGELSLLGFIRDASSYKQLVRSTLISHVEGTLPMTAESNFPEVNKIIKNIALTEGNNPKIPYMISGYFADMDEIFREMWRVCKSGAKLAFVVANARWGGVVIPVDHLLMQQIENIGFVPERILVTRYKGNSPQQMRRFGRIPVRESIVVFSKP